MLTVRPIEARVAQCNSSKTIRSRMGTKIWGKQKVIHLVYNVRGGVGKVVEAYESGVGNMKL